jgi:hypothetical protein
MSTCAKLSAGASPDCVNPIFSGVDDEVLLINFDDITGYTYNVTNPEIIEAITLASGAVAYSFQGQNFSNEPDHAYTKSGFSNFFNHQIRLRVFANDPETKKQLNLVANGKFVAIIKNNYVNAAGNTAYELYGLKNGLVQQDGVRTVASIEEGGAHNILIGSHESALEPKLPATVFITDFDTTKTMVDALKA